LTKFSALVVKQLAKSAGLSGGNVGVLSEGRVADALESDLRPLAHSGIINRVSKFDTNPANNPQPPERLRQ
jgi:hypothetical protein